MNTSASQNFTKLHQDVLYDTLFRANFFPWRFRKNKAERFARCLLLVTFYLLLVTFCSLLVTFCLLLVTFCSLLVTICSLLVTFCLLLVTICSLLFARCSLLFRPNNCQIKLMWTAKEWFHYKQTPPQIFSLQIF